jgi:hypothetical protein
MWCIPQVDAEYVARCFRRDQFYDGHVTSALEQPVHARKTDKRKAIIASGNERPIRCRFSKVATVSRAIIREHPKPKASARIQKAFQALHRPKPYPSDQISMKVLRIGSLRTEDS